MKEEKIYEYFSSKINRLNKKYEESKEIIHDNEIELTELKTEIGNLNYHISNLDKKEKKDYFKLILSKLFPTNSKLFMAINLICHMVIHPIRAFSLVSKIKKFNYHEGDNLLDILYLRYGKINIKNNSKPKVSIIIPVYNQIEYTYKCLMSIEENTKDVPYEVIIANDVSFDGTRVLDLYVDGITVIKNKTNMGFLKNCNNAATIAKGEYILFLNNDTKVQRKWLSSLVELIESDSSIGMVGSKLVYPDGRLQEAGGVIFNNGGGCNYGKFDNPDRPQYNYVRDVDYISGASLMISTKLWKEIGGFDVRYAPAYCEDSDLAFEVRNHGYRVVYQPKSVVIHFEGISNGTDVNSSSGLKHYQVVNNKKLKSKWKNELESLPEPTANRLDFSFRDRIEDKKVVLVVDHYVPEFDKDAGSRTTYQYLNMLVKKGYIVKFLPDNYNDSKPYTNYLEQMGIEVLYGKWYKENIEKWILLNKDNIDIVYFNRPHITVKYIDFFKDNTSIKIIYYGHDLHFLREKREYEITKDEYHLNESEKWKEVEFSIMKKSDVVYYPSYVEEEVIKKIDSSIPVKAINAYMFDHVNENKKYNFREKEGILFVGGFTHRPNVDAVNWFSQSIYPLVKKSINIPFYIVGSNPPSSITKLNGNGIVVKGYVTDSELEELYKKCRLIVAPLRYGAGIKGKIIEAMQKGIPVVTTSCGAEGIKNTDDLLIVSDNEEDFANKILEVYNNFDLLQKISFNERKYINDNYSLEAAYNIVKNDFQKNYDYLVVTADGFANNRDEASLNGILQLIGENKSIKILTIRNKNLSKKFNLSLKNVSEEIIKLSDINKYVPMENNLIIIGNNIIDGSMGIDDSLARLELASEFSKDNKDVYIYCSFKDNVDEKIIYKINKLSSKVKFYLTDNVSLKNFNKQTNVDGLYFPNLSYFAKESDDDRYLEIKDDLEITKMFSSKLIGLNFSELLFKSIYNSEYSFDKCKKNIEETIDLLIDKFKNPYFVLISSNIKYLDETMNDKDYQKVVVDYLKLIGYKKYKNISDDITYTGLLNIISTLDIMITGRIEYCLASIKNNVIPLVYIGKNNNMYEEINDIIKEYLGNDSFVVNNHDEMKKIINNISDKKYDYDKFIKKMIEENKKNLHEFDKMKKIILKEE